MLLTISYSESAYPITPDYPSSTVQSKFLGWRDILDKQTHNNRVLIIKISIQYLACLSTCIIGCVNKSQILNSCCVFVCPVFYY